MQRYRFWTFVNNDAVKLTISKDKALKWAKVITHDEGWEIQHMHWYIDVADDTLVVESFFKGKDCDGPYTSYDKLKARLTRLNYLRGDHDIHLPEFKLIECGQQDLTAERMGY